MKRLVSALASMAAVLAASGMVAPAAVADPPGPGLTPGFTASDITGCTGTTSAHLTLTGVEPPPTQRALDVELVLDESGSVGVPDFSALKSGAITFAQNLLGAGNQLGVVTFSSNALVRVAPTTSEATAVNGISGIYQRGGNTAIGAGLQAAASQLATYGRAGSTKVIILETDGFNNVASPDPVTTANGIKAGGTRIFAVGIGAAPETSELSSIASSIPGVTTVYRNPDYTALAATLTSIAGSVEVPAATGISYTMHPAPGFTLIMATASKGTVTPSGNGFTYNLAQLGDETVTVSYTLGRIGTHDDAAAPIQSTADLAWTAVGGAPQSESFADRTIAVSGCNQPPTADAGPDQTVTLSDSHTAPVQLDGTGSTDDGRLGPLSFTWAEGGNTIATGASPTVPMGAGTHHVTLTVDDGQYAATDDVTVTVADATPPVIAPTVNGPLGAHGWYTGDVDVTWAVTDPESDVTSTTGCDPQTVDSDTAGTTLTCSATSGGGTSSAHVAVRRDATAPTVSYSGNAGSYALTDTVHITCSSADATSGIASDTCTSVDSPAYELDAGAHTLTATATDNAGNVGHGSTTFTVVVDADTMCGLIDSWVSNQGVANSLCTKLQHGSWAAFDNEVAAQSGKKLTDDQAADLLRLRRAL